jgi:hypothetical protein
MKPIEFKGQTHDFRKPETMNDNQCQSLPALVHIIDIEGEKFNAIESVWELTDDEIKEILESKCIRLRVVANGMPPVVLMVEPKEVIEDNVVSMNPNMKFWPESSSVARTEYLPEKNILEVEFRSGKTYHYKNFPAILFADVIEAKSIGQYINKNIKGQFEEELI